MNILYAFILAYLYGSIPFTFLIGKFIYNKNILKEGSKNCGGSNLGRVCGSKAFIISFIFDASKGVMAVLLANLFNINPILLLLPILIGHSFSIFLKFKGGKGVASACGFVLAYSFLPAICALIVFVLVLYWKKYVSLASIIAIGFYLLYAIIFETHFYALAVLILYLFVIYLHRENIKRIKNGTENKITWM